jgi:putative membrane protein insertion efficiency factor
LGGIVKLLVLGLVRFYQASISPVLPSACRHYPSCSAYAFEAVEKWGVGKGVRLALGRLLRCRPWGSFGYDPVPEKNSEL